LTRPFHERCENSIDFMFVWMEETAAVISLVSDCSSFEWIKRYG
jgi:hypothetical protein